MHDDRRRAPAPRRHDPDDERPPARRDGGPTVVSVAGATYLAAMVTRCEWVRHPALRGVPRRGVGRAGPRRPELFEFLLLEGAQAGLAWITILRKREGYRKAYDGFDPAGGRPLERRPGRAPAEGPGDRAQPPQGGRGAQVRARAPASSWGEGGSRAWLWQFVGGEADREPLPFAEGAPGAHRRGHGDEQGPEEARLHVRGPHDLLRVHAGHRNGERPRGGLLPVPAGPTALNPRRRAPERPVREAMYARSSASIPGSSPGSS